MNLSPQSCAVIDSLLSGGTVTAGPITIGPFDKNAVFLLRAIVENVNEFNELKGDDRARKLRDRYLSESAKGAPQEKESTTKPPTQSANQKPTEWLLVELSCASIRGIAPPGERITFDFNTDSQLIYGPNGSGKSSLLAAIVWVVTGSAVIDATDPIDEAPVYKSSSGTGSGPKVRDWPVIATLPLGNDVVGAVPSSFGEILLSSSGSHSLRLRRTIGLPLEVSSDGKNWTRPENLTEFGIQPLDIQLSLVAPTVFGRRSIEDARDARALLTLMLGFDDLEHLGDLASNIASNRTKLEVDPKNWTT